MIRQSTDVPADLAWSALVAWVETVAASRTRCYHTLDQIAV
jgi:hypothetical protein